MERKAWFCPGCQRHHGPHVDTCPGIGAQPARVVPGIIPYQPPRDWNPAPTSDSWVPYWPQITCGGASYPSDPTMIVMN